MKKIGKIVKKHHDGVIFDIFVTPSARNIVFPKGYNNWRRCIEISVCAPAEKDKANKEVIQTVANFFDRPLSDIYILSGRQDREKTVLIKGASVDTVFERLRDSLNGL
jgi:uncharacterized protein (TIGR00251 family)